ncbi:MAG: hypothetical protein IPM97_01775 [Bdellovibrionaceae bacterium]|nr:hypothetical protein [Pseudobdellovibrionaceae bacterium]
MKVEESVTNYFSYVKNVLGVRGVKSTAIRDSLSAVTTPEFCDLLFIHIKESQDQGISVQESKELLDKMIQAMRLGGKKHLIYEHEVDGDIDVVALVSSMAAVRPSSFVVVFSAKPGASGVIKNLGVQKYLETFSPSYLLQNPAAKKVVWADLQKVMKELGTL